MTDKEIIKALECCGNVITSSCKECSYHSTYNANCVRELMRNALDLINRQQAKIEVLVEDTLCLRDTLKENESLRAEIERLTELFEGWKKAAYKAADDKEEIYRNAIENVKNARAEAIKEFAEQVKLEFYKEFDELIPSIMADRIDNLVKEMIKPSLLDKKFGGELE